MKLQCSAGHKWDSEKLSDNWWKGSKKPGDRCGEVLRYDIMAGGTTRCRRVLKQSVTIEAVQRNEEWTWVMTIDEKTMESSREFSSKQVALQDGVRIAKGCGLMPAIHS